MRVIKLALSAMAVSTLVACDSADSDAAATSHEEAPAPAKVYAVGESVNRDGIEFTLVSVEERTNASGNAFAEPAGPGEIFVVAKYAIKNLGDKPLDTLGLPDVELMDAKGTVYAEDIRNSAFVSAGETGSLSDINPSVTYRTGTAWKVAKGAFDPATWKIAVRADPSIEYRLK